MAGISSKAAGSLENKYKYNGNSLENKEFSDGTGLEEYYYGARMYDNQIGRWSIIDPLSEKFSLVSPYSFTSNSPIFFIDRNGEDIIPGANWKGSSYEKVFNNLKSNSLTFQLLLAKFENSKTVNLYLEYTNPVGFTTGSGYQFTESASPGIMGRTGIDKFTASWNGSPEGGQLSKYDAYSFLLPSGEIKANTGGMNDLGRAINLIHEITHAYSHGNSSDADFAEDEANEQQGEGVLSEYISVIQDGINEYAKANNITLSDDGWDLKALSILGTTKTSLAEKYAVDYAKYQGITLNKENTNYINDINKFLDQIALRAILLMFNK